VHLSCHLGRSQHSSLEQDIRERDDPAFVVGQGVDHLCAECLDAAPLFLGVDDLVKVENISERMTALLPGQQLVLHLLDRRGFDAANIVWQSFHQCSCLGHGAFSAAGLLAGMTPIMASRVTRAASCSSVNPSVPSGRRGRTRYLTMEVESLTRISTSSGMMVPNSARTARGSETARDR